ncbi:hypothetical protein E4L96_20680 [Massilia arenosa]|uniref:Uncharacterized protein n=1 Tax=Zemynaea arenosa TaxID=2561931 RepID=A0A4Y9RS39_9BURK|nr:hypothetical protein [Massilia arenosa]TFW11703.1 hypothetical protein E4L96_20680 [Massilia arenosa]
MRDKKDIATIELPGFFEAAQLPLSLPEPPASKRPRARRAGLKQEQLSLLEDTDITGLPIWQRDDSLDLTGLPVWAP